MGRFRWHGFSRGDRGQTGIKSLSSFPFHSLCFMLAHKDEPPASYSCFHESHLLQCFPTTMYSHSSGTMFLLYVALVMMFHHSKKKMTNTTNTCMTTTNNSEINALYVCFISLMYHDSHARPLSKAPHTAHRYTQTSAGIKLGVGYGNRYDQR